MAGLLSDILGFVDRAKQSTRANVGLLMDNPQEYARQINESARDINRQDTLAVQGQNAMLAGRQPTPEQMAAMDAMRQRTENLAMGFAGSTKPLNNPANTLEKMSPWFIKYPKADKVVDGLSVGKEVKNMSSIPASFEKYEVEKGIKSVPMSDFPASNPYQMFRSSVDIKRVQELAEQIKANKRIDPLIVTVDKEGSYVLEGVHRLGALNLLGIKNFPAVIVRDLD
jgi:hypothetical protein